MRHWRSENGHNPLWSPESRDGRIAELRCAKDQYQDAETGHPVTVLGTGSPHGVGLTAHEQALCRRSQPDVTQVIGTAAAHRLISKGIKNEVHGARGLRAVGAFFSQERHARRRE